MTRLTIEVPTGKTTDGLIRFAHRLAARRGAQVTCHLTISAPPAIAGEILKALQRVGLQLPTYLSTSDERPEVSGHEN